MREDIDDRRTGVRKSDLEAGMVVRTRYGRPVTISALEDPYPDIENAPHFGPGFVAYVLGDNQEAIVGPTGEPAIGGVTAIRNIVEIVKE